eukprot:gene13295-17812_t
MQREAPPQPLLTNIFSETKDLRKALNDPISKAKFDEPFPYNIPSKAMCHFFYKGLLLVGDQKIYKCECCKATVTGNKSGWTNLMNHLESHALSNAGLLEEGQVDVKALTKERYYNARGITNPDGNMLNFVRPTSSLSNTVVTNQALWIEKWLKGVVLNDLPISFVDYPFTRTISKNMLDPISRKTFKKYLEIVSNKVCENIKEELRNKKIGLIFDGWSADGVQEHYVAIFATYTEEIDALHYNVKTFLLCFCPLLEIAKFDANAHLDLIKETLRWYGLNLSNVDFLLGDNCNLNVSLGRLATSNLFIDIIEEIHKLVMELRTPKNMSRIKNCKRIAKKIPLDVNATRWSSVFNMIQRYIELVPLIKESQENNEVDFPEEVLEKLPVDDNRFTEIKNVFNTLKELMYATKVMQGEN